MPDRAAAQVQFGTIGGTTQEFAPNAGPDPGGCRSLKPGLPSTNDMERNHGPGGGRHCGHCQRRNPVGRWRLAPAVHTGRDDISFPRAPVAQQ
jgi:hypothetical protein